MISFSNINKNSNGSLNVPDFPVIPFIEGDGTGPDIWRATRKVVDAAVQKAYSGKKKIQWLEILAGEKGFHQTGEWLPEQTLEAIAAPCRGHQGTAHHAGGKGHSKRQCHPSPETGPLCLYSACLLYSGCSQPHETSGKSQYGDFPGKYRRCLCRH